MSNSKTKRRANWYDYDTGFSIGTVGADDGAIVRDEEHPSGARLTLEEESSSAPFAITCQIYGWLRHTRYFSDETEAAEEFDRMEEELEEILDALPADEETADDETRREVLEVLTMFTERFP